MGVHIYELLQITSSIKDTLRQEWRFILYAS